MPKYNPVASAARPSRGRRLVFVVGGTTLLSLAATVLCVPEWQGFMPLYRNFLLAAAPLAFAFAAGGRFPGWAKGIFWGLWVLFFPNAPYMLTDLLHLTRFSFVENGRYTLTTLPWLGLCLIVLPVLAGSLCGFYSLYLMQGRVRARFGSLLSWLFATMASLAGGIAIYIGRFIRLNSWNMLDHAETVAIDLTAAWGPHTLLLCLLFAALILGAYALCYACFFPDN